ncbi:hypothetical protein D3C72_689620 [compost metagenome]
MPLENIARGLKRRCRAVLAVLIRLKILHFGAQNIELAQEIAAIAQRRARGELCSPTGRHDRIDQYRQGYGDRADLAGPRRQMTARAVAGHDDAFGIGAQPPSIGVRPAQGRDAIIQGSRVPVFRRASIVDVNDDALSRRAIGPHNPFIGLGSAQNPAAAVDVQHQRD